MSQDQCHAYLKSKRNTQVLLISETVLRARPKSSSWKNRGGFGSDLQRTVFEALVQMCSLLSTGVFAEMSILFVTDHDLEYKKALLFCIVLYRADWKTDS